MFLKQKPFAWLVMIVLCLCTRTGVYAQQQHPAIVQGEYYFDADPGAGFASALTAEDGNFDNAIERVVNSSITGLSAGTHRLGIRFLGTDGNWGPVYKTSVFVSASATASINVTQAEFYFDADPGSGSATALIAFDGNFNDAIEAVLKSNVVQPSVGTHLLGVRVKDANGQWGPVFKTTVNTSTAFTSSVQVSSAEYYIDADPGAGSGIAMVAFDGNYTDAIETVLKSNGALPAIGTHILGVRVKDANNNWGPAFKTTVNVSTAYTASVKVSAAEYYLDADPGAGSAITMLAYDGNYSDAIETVFKNAAAQPSYGIHKLGVRLKDINGKWGPAFITTLSMDSTYTSAVNVIAGEFYYDTDPGQGNAYAMVAFDGNFNDAIEKVSSNPSLSPLVTGVHTLNVRVRGRNGRWGKVFTTVFEVEACTQTPTVNISPNTTQTICTGDSIVFSATAVGTGITYQWRKDGANITGATSSTYTATTAGIYDLAVYNGAGCGGSSAADTVRFSATAATPSVSITANTGTTICTGTNVRFTAVPANGGPTPHYQWMVNSIAVGTDSSSYTTSSLTNGATVTVLLTSTASCVTSTTASSAPLTMTVNGLVTPSITVSPSATTICSGSAVVFTAGPVNGGAAPHYQWKVNGLNAGTDSIKFTTASLTNGASVTVVLTSNADCVSPSTATSTPVVITVTAPVTPSVSVAATATTICPGTYVTFTASAVNGGAAPSYQWFRNGAHVGTDSTKYTSAVLANNDSVWVVLTSSNLCVNSNSPASNHLRITVSPTRISTISASICAGSSYAGHTITGTYLDHYTAANGCDSARTLNLTVNPTVNSTVATSICSGSNYAGHTATGTYVDHYTSAAGCDSARTLNLTINPSVASTINTAICSGSSYAGHTSAGTYVDYYTSVGGCDSARTLNLTVNSTIATTITTAICSGSSYAGHTASGTFVDHYTSTAGCDSARTLNLTVNSSITTTVTTSICAGSSYAGHSSIGTFVDHYTSTAGCDSARTLNLTVNSSITTTVTTSICAGSSYAGHSSTGTFVDHYTSAAGCDSARTLNLTIKPNVTSTVTTTICAGASYAGHSTTGTFVDHYTNSAGCDSARTLNLTVNPTVTSTVTTAICTGAYAGHNASGTFVDHFTSVTGCDSARTLNLTVNPNVTSTVTKVICSGSSYAGHTTTGTYVDHYTSAAGCDSARTLSLTVNSTIASSVTASICTGSSYAGHTVSGTFVDHYTSVAGCDSARTLNLTVNSTIATTVTTAICAGGSYAGHSSTGTFVDHYASVAGCDSARTLNLSINPIVTSTVTTAICAGTTYAGHNSTGTFVDHYTSATGCDSARTLNLTVNPNVTSTVTAAICAGGSYGGHSVTGTFVDHFISMAGCDSARTLNLTVAPAVVSTVTTSICAGSAYAGHTTAGTFVDHYTSVSGCDSARTLVLTVNPAFLPTVSISASQNNVCSGTAVTFTATPTNSGTTPAYQWTVNGINAGTNSSTFAPTSVTNNDTIAVTLTSSDACSNTHAVASPPVIMIVTQPVTPAITISTNDSTTMCAGTTITFHAIAVNGGATPVYHWQVNGVNVTGTVTDSYSTNTLNDGDTISCVLASALACVTNATVVSNHIGVTVNAVPAIPVITQSHDTLISSASSGNQWISNTTDIMGATTQTYIPLYSGSYTVRVTLNGCSATSAPFAFVHSGVEDVRINEMISVYPDPFKDGFTISLSPGNRLSEDWKVSITDAEGRLIRQDVLTQNETTIYLGDKASGVYFARIYNSTGYAVRKLVKE